MKPILFNTDMVRATLEGRKTVTRRVVKISGWKIVGNGEHTGFGSFWFDVANDHTCTTISAYPPYLPGYVLYVRETFFKFGCDYIYRASATQPDLWNGMWHPSIHMPREAARIFLRVTNVRVEKLRDISMKDIRNEGIEYDIERPVASYGKFVERWDSTIKPKDRALYGWDTNPYVWVISFERISKEEALRCT